MPEILIDCEDYPEFSELSGSLTKQLATIMNVLGISGDVTVKLGNADESKYLNGLYRNKDEPTDVLSFILNDPLPDGRFYCGDIHIAYPVAQAQAQEAGHSVEKEIFILATHGLLHLAGYDHETDTGEMMEMQANLLAKHAL